MYFTTECKKYPATFFNQKVQKHFKKNHSLNNWTVKYEEGMNF